MKLEQSLYRPWVQKTISFFTGFSLAIAICMGWYKLLDVFLSLDVTPTEPYFFVIRSFPYVLAVIGIGLFVYFLKIRRHWIAIGVLIGFLLAGLFFLFALIQVLMLFIGVFGY